MSALLEARGLNAGYGGHPVVHDLDLRVDAGELVVLLGANGAGKTTTLLTLAGALSTVSGDVLFMGQVTRAPVHRRARKGLSLVPEERSLISRLTVEQNLRVGRSDPRTVLQFFPELEPHLKRRAGLLSGGQQQMLAVGRALGRRPDVLVIDELSLGLAPLLVTRLLAGLREAVDTFGIGALVVEQHIDAALAAADRGYVLSRGRVTMTGMATEIAHDRSAIAAAYL